MSELLTEELGILREIIRANDGSNVAVGAFGRKVDQLISDFYDDIGELTDLRLTDILDLFLIKVLYVNRHSRDAATLEYLGQMLSRHLQTSELSAGGGGRGFALYMSDLVEETTHPSGAYQNLFEACRRYGDNSLFISGLFPQSLGRKRGGGVMGGAAFVDKTYLITMGRRYYELAAEQELARRVDLRGTLLRLAQYFDVYVDALNEMSDRYVIGMDMRIIADKMLDAFNRYRTTKDEKHLQAARKYAALLKLDARHWPALQRIESTPSYF